MTRIPEAVSDNAARLRLAYCHGAQKHRHRNLAELHEVYRKTPPLFTDETGNPDPDGSFNSIPGRQAFPRHGDRQQLRGACPREHHR
jgi:hypothetical protein